MLLGLLDQFAGLPTQTTDFVRFFRLNTLKEGLCLLHQSLAQLGTGCVGQCVLRMLLDKLAEPLKRLFEGLVPFLRIARRLGRRYQSHPGFVINDLLQLGGTRGIGSQHIQVLDCRVVVSTRFKGFQKPLRCTGSQKPLRCTGSLSQERRVCKTANKRQSNRQSRPNHRTYCLHPEPAKGHSPFPQGMMYRYLSFTNCQPSSPVV